VSISIATNEKGFMSVLEFITSCQEQGPIKKPLLNICKKPIVIRPLEPLLIANKKMKFQRPASIA
jgi:hypothetical protein